MAPGRFVFVKSRSKTHIVFLSSETLTGDARDVQRVVRQILNKSTGNRLIPKQECMVLLAGLDLVKCSDTIDTVSVSGHARIMKKKENETKKATFLDQYRFRHESHWHMSFHDFYHHKKNMGVCKKSTQMKIPHYVGINSQPKYPVTENYARGVITLYKPWKGDDLLLKRDWIEEFHEFINSNPRCPRGVSISYHRILERHITKTSHYEPIAASVDHSHNAIDGADKEALEIVGTKTMNGYDPCDSRLSNADTGKNTDWSEEHVTVSTSNLFFFFSVNVQLRCH